MSSPEKKSKPSRWLKPVLAVSLMLNLAVAGLVVGAAVNQKEQTGRRSGAPLGVLELGPLTDALNDADREALRGALVAKRGDFQKARRDLRAGFAEVQTALTAQPFDRAVLENVLVLQSQRIGDQAVIVRTLWLDRVDAMTDAERQEFATQLKEVLRRGPPKAGRK